MTPIEHKIQAIRQQTAECAQTAAAQTLSFFEPSITADQIVAAVPVYINERGEKVGTSPGHLAAYIANKGYTATAYIFDTELFDRSWQGMESAQVVQSLRRRQQHIPANAWLAKYHQVLVDGWEQFQQAGGRFEFPMLSVSLLRQLLDGGPLLTNVNSTYFNGGPKRRYDIAADAFVDDVIGGVSLTHTMTCAGYKDGKFLIIDPDPPEGTAQHRWENSDHVIASIMAAQTESINLLVAVQPPAA